MRSNPAAAWDKSPVAKYKPLKFAKQFREVAQVLTKRNAKKDHVTLSRRRAWRMSGDSFVQPAPRVSFVNWR